MRCFSLVTAGIALVASVTALARGPTYRQGRAPTEQEIRAWDIAIGPAGKELPPGSGTAKDGAAIFKQKTAYEMRISDWSSDVCSSDLSTLTIGRPLRQSRDGRSEGDPCRNKIKTAHRECSHPD